MYFFNGGENLKIRAELGDFRVLFYVLQHILWNLFGGFGNLSYLCGVNVNYHL